MIKNNVLRGNNTSYAGKSLWWGGQIFTRTSKDVQIFGNDITATGLAQNGIAIYSEVENGVNVMYSGPNCGTIEQRNVTVHDNVIELGVGHQSGVAGGGMGYGANHNISYSNNVYYLQDLAGTYFQWDAQPLLTKELWRGYGQDVTGRFYQY